jgi:hypothetical protein
MLPAGHKVFFGDSIFAWTNMERQKKAGDGSEGDAGEIFFSGIYGMGMYILVVSSDI